MTAPIPAPSPLLTLTDFAPFVGVGLRLTSADGEVLSAVLEKTVASSWTRAGAAREPFSLLFTVAGRTFLPQQIYRLLHPQRGEVEIFLVPVGHGATGVQMEAVFN